MGILLPPRLKFDIKKNLKKNIEIEARFRKNINEKSINNIKTYLENTLNKKESFEIDYYIKGEKGNVRVTKKGNKYFEIEKRNILSNILSKENIKISLSYESEEIETFKPNDFFLKREKKRISYILDNYSIDITLINDDKYEFEIEVIDNEKLNIDDFEKILTKFYNLLIDDEKKIEVFLKKKLGENIYLNLSRARDLLVEDMTKEGILDNYAISLKADGEQKLLLFIDGEIFRYYPSGKKEIEKINSESLKSLKLDGSIITGEYIKEKDLYLSFDCLFYKDEDMRDKDYLTRYSMLDNFKNIKKKEILIPKKEINDFYDKVKEAFMMIENSDYKTDGLIFTPIYNSYVTDGQRIGKNRILSKNKDVVKYKEPENLSFDLLVKEDGLYTKEKKFIGTKKNKFTEENYEFDVEDIGKIIEFKPYFENDKIIYRKYRIRDDKTYPNKYNVVSQLWDLIHIRITKETMTGKDNKLMRRYHNEIKKDLLSNIKGEVIDIGAGAGGVLNKYLKNDRIKKVLSVEPNLEFAEEFERRRNKISKDKDKDKFKLIIAGGEDTEEIISNAIDFLDLDDEINICFHISLSFFWKNKKMLMNLSNTIKKIKQLTQKKVNIVYLTIEGNRVENLFNSIKKDNIKLNNIFLKKINKNEIYIDFIGSVTVHEQTEYLVKLNELWELIGIKRNLNEKEADNKSKNGYILSENELIYSSLFVYGIITLGIDDIKSKKGNCIEINEKKAYRTKDGIIKAKGDDTKIKITNDFYRVGTLNIYSKLCNSLLKLTNEEYKNSDVFKRVKMAKKLNEELNNEKDFNKISKMIGFNIGIFGGKKYGNEEKTIYLYECEEGCYEPIIRKDGKSIF